MSTQKCESALTQTNAPLKNVVIFVSQQLATRRTFLHQQCTALGGKFVWVFNVPFTHYICQGKLSKRGKEYRKVEEYRAICVHPAWLTACHKYGQRIAEKLYATTYNPNRSLTFIAADDNDDIENNNNSGNNDNDDNNENCRPSLSIVQATSLTQKSIAVSCSISIMNTQRSIHRASPVSSISISSSPKQLSQTSNDAEIMLNDLESSLAQFLNNNNSTTCSSRPSIPDDVHNKKSLQIMRSITNANNENHNSDSSIEPSMRVEWLDDAMQAERKKIRDEDEHGIGHSQQQQSSNGQSRNVPKRSLIDSNFDETFKSKKCRT